MAKNIVVCLDGTGNEFGAANSNVVKLFQTLVRSKEQIAYYHPGLGTSGFLNRPSSVLVRMADPNLNYSPKNLPVHYRVEK